MERIPPKDNESEMALLGALMVDQSIADNVMVGMKPEYFYQETHQTIFNAMVQLYKKNVGIDMGTVVNSLTNAGSLDVVGGSVYIMDLTMKISSGYNHGFHMASIIDKYVRREQIRIFNTGMEKSFDLSKDIADTMSEINTELMNVQSIFSGVERAKKLDELAEQSVENYFERKKIRLQGKTIGITTGLRKLDSFTGGWQNGDSIILAGRTSMGKTALAMHFATAAFKSDKKVQIFSFEMTADKLADRIMVGVSRVPADLFKNGNLDNKEEQQLEYGVDYLKDSGVYIDDNTNLNIDQVFAKCRIAKKKGQCDLIIIDYIGLVQPENKNDIREQQVAQMSRKIKKYAKELNVPVITLAQLNRGGESTATKRPKLSDLRESGALEQDADIVIFGYRPEYYGITSIDVGNDVIETSDMGFAIVAKHRNGPIGDVLFKHSFGMNLIEDYETDSGSLPF